MNIIFCKFTDCLSWTLRSVLSPDEQIRYVEIELNDGSETNNVPVMLPKTKLNIMNKTRWDYRM